MSSYIFTGPVNPDGGISAEQATNIGTSIAAAYQQGLEDATAATSTGDLLSQHQTAIIAGAAALLLLAFVSSMRR